MNPAPPVTRNLILVSHQDGAGYHIKIKEYLAKARQCLRYGFMPIRRGEQQQESSTTGPKYLATDGSSLSRAGIPVINDLVAYVMRQTTFYCPCLMHNITQLHKVTFEDTYQPQHLLECADVAGVIGMLPLQNRYCVAMQSGVKQ